MEACIDEHLEVTWPDIDSIDEDDSYIEIELDTSRTCCNDDDDDGEGKEYQLRISISSTISLSLPHVQKDESLSLQTNFPIPKVAAIEAPCMSSLLSFSADDDTTKSTRAGSKEIMPLQNSGVSEKIDEQGVEEEFSVTNQLCNTNTTIPLNPGVGLQSPQPDGQTTILRSTRVIPCDNVDVLHASARKQPNFKSTTTTTGGMMKLLIKFRGIKIGAILASLIKPRQASQANNNGHKSSKKSKTFFQCYQKRLANPTNGRCNVKRDQGIGRSKKHWEFEDDIICGSFRSSKKSSRVMEMDLGALRGIFNAMGMNIAKKGSRSKRRAESTSCDTTPIHEEFSLYTNENSIQAAIAYCKSSFGQTPDFSF